MFYVGVVAAEFAVTILGVACLVTYYNHKTLVSTKNGRIKN